jgi:hypothetical protein
MYLLVGLFVFNDTIEGPRAPAIKSGRVTPASGSSQFPTPPWVGSRSLMVGIRSPDGLVVGSFTSHPGVLGSIPKREEPGETGRHPVFK